jgi:hypothetical protein
MVPRPTSTSTVMPPLASAAKTAPGGQQQLEVFADDAQVGGPVLARRVELEAVKPLHHPQHVDAGDAGLVVGRHDVELPGGQTGAARGLEQHLHQQAFAAVVEGLPIALEERGARGVGAEPPPGELLQDGRVELGIGQRRDALLRSFRDRRLEGREQRCCRIGTRRLCADRQPARENQGGSQEEAVHRGSRPPDASRYCTRRDGVDAETGRDTVRLT